MPSMTKSSEKGVTTILSREDRCEILSIVEEITDPRLKNIIDKMKGHN